MNALTISKPYAAILRDRRRTWSIVSQISEWLAVVQGFYYIALGLWPMISMSSFQNIAGPASDALLAKALGGLLVMVGGVLVLAAVRSALSLELGLLLIGCSLVLGVFDVIYVMQAVPTSFRYFEAAEEFLVMFLSCVFLGSFTHRRHSTFL